MNDDIFELWLKTCFLPATVHLRHTGPVALYLDNFGSHTTLEVLRTCQQHNIILVGLPPHSSHILQPLDVSVNGPLKQHFKNAIGWWRLKDDNCFKCVLHAAKQAHPPSTILIIIITSVLSTILSCWLLRARWGLHLVPAVLMTVLTRLSCH